MCVFPGFFEVQGLDGKNYYKFNSQGFLGEDFVLFLVFFVVVCGFKVVSF